MDTKTSQMWARKQRSESGHLPWSASHGGNTATIEIDCDLTERLTSQETGGRLADQVRLLSNHYQGGLPVGVSYVLVAKSATATGWEPHPGLLVPLTLDPLGLLLRLLSRHRSHDPGTEPPIRTPQVDFTGNVGQRNTQPVGKDYEHLQLSGVPSQPVLINDEDSVHYPCLEV